MGWLLERRGYVQAGPWTPEAVIEFPEVNDKLITCGVSHDTDVEKESLT